MPACVRSLLVTVVGAAAVLLGGATAEGAERLRVVTTTTDLKALTEAVGGDRVEVDALARGTQNPHDVEVRPSLMVKVRRADVLVVNGLELDQWAEVVVQGANNPKLGPGAPGRIDASAGLLVLDVPKGRVDRSMGDVHPMGNPHYTLDPGLAPAITANLLEGLARAAPAHRAAFERQREAFLGRLEEAMARWTTTLAPFNGAKVVQYHPDFVYLLTRFGLVNAGTIEDRPGIPPTPAHLARLIQAMKDQQVRLVVVEPWSDVKLAERIARDAGARVRVLAPTVGALKEADGYLAMLEHNVRALAEGLRQP